MAPAGANLTRIRTFRVRPTRSDPRTRPAYRTEAVNSTLSSPTALHSRSSGPDETRCPGAHETPSSPTRRLARPSCTPRKEIAVPKTVALDPSPASVTEHEVPAQDTRLTEAEPADAVVVAAAQAPVPAEPGAPGEPGVPADPEAPEEPDAPGLPDAPEPAAPPELPAPPEEVPAPPEEVVAPEEVLELSESEEPEQAVSKTSMSIPARAPE